METHFAAGSVLLGRNLGRFLTEGLIEIHTAREEHDRIAAEMLRRGYNHNSPLIDFPVRVAGKIDSEANTKELIRRCLDCRERIQSGIYAPQPNLQEGI